VVCQYIEIQVAQNKTSSLLTIFCKWIQYNNYLQTHLQTYTEWLLKMPNSKSTWDTKGLKHFLNQIVPQLNEITAHNVR
jgi:hypothetical protein